MKNIKQSKYKNQNIYQLDQINLLSTQLHKIANTNANTSKALSHLQQTSRIILHDQSKQLKQISFVNKDDSKQYQCYSTTFRNNIHKSETISPFNLSHFSPPRKLLSDIKSQEEIEISHAQNMRTLVPKKINLKLLSQDVREFIYSLLKKISKIEQTNIIHKDNIIKLTKNNEELFNKVQQYKIKIQNCKEAIDPYRNNVILMNGIVQAIKVQIKDKIKNINNKIDESSDKDLSNQSIRQFYQQQIIQQDKQLQNKVNSLREYIQILIAQNCSLKESYYREKQHNQVLTEVLNEAQKTSQYRQLYFMTSQQLLQIKIKCKMLEQRKEKIQKLNFKLNHKILMLTSLVGYGVLSEIKSQDIEEMAAFTESIANSQLGNKLTSDIYGLNHIPNAVQMREVIQGQIASISDNLCQRRLYIPNFMIFYQHTYRQMMSQMEEGYNNVIKYEFFLLIRGIMDCKYTDYRLFGNKASKFPDFVEMFIRQFKIKPNYKRIILTSKLPTSTQQKQLIKIGLLIKLLDKKISKLPEVISFREFLLKQTPDDQLYYYLICRRLIHDGAQLLDYINCGDPFSYVRYDKIQNIIFLLLENFDRKIRDIVFTHINSKKIVKGKIILIKSSYITRLMLQLYRKTKHKKIEKLKDIFESVFLYNKIPLMKYIHFKEILEKNFSFLCVSDIADMYRRAASIFHIEKNLTTFFECFNAVCLSDILFKEIQKWEKDIEQKLEPVKQDIKSPISQLYPEAIYEHGNDKLCRQYLNSVSKNSTLYSKLQHMKFLINIAQAQVLKSNMKRDKNFECQLLNNQFYIVEWVNKNYRKRQLYQCEMQEASKIIGVTFKKKIYQFYQQFILDINKQIPKNKNVLV